MRVTWSERLASIRFVSTQLPRPAVEAGFDWVPDSQLKENLRRHMKSLAQPPDLLQREFPFSAHHFGHYAASTKDIPEVLLLQAVLLHQERQRLQRCGPREL